MPTRPEKDIQLLADGEFLPLMHELGLRHIAFQCMNPIQTNSTQHLIKAYDVASYVNFVSTTKLAIFFFRYLGGVSAV